MVFLVSFFMVILYGFKCLEKLFIIFVIRVFIGVIYIILNELRLKVLFSCFFKLSLCKMVSIVILVFLVLVGVYKRRFLDVNRVVL